MHNRLVLSIVLILVVSLLAVSGITTASDEAGDVRLLHAIVGLGAADFYLNDNFAGTLSYGNAADYMLVAPGEARVRAFAPDTGPDGTPLFEGTFALESAQHMNVAVVGTTDAPTLVAHPINTEPLGFGQGRLGLIHLVTDGSAVNATVTAVDGTTTTLAQDLALGEKTTVELPTGRYTLNVEGLLSDVMVHVNYGTMLTLFLVGTADGDVPIEVRPFPSATILEEPAGYLRLINAVEANPITDAPSLDFYLNGTLTSSSVNFGPVSTVYFALAVGDYEWALYEAGADAAEALSSGTLTVEENVSLGMVALMSEGGVTATLYTDDRTPVTERSSGVNLFNASSQPQSLMIDGDIVVDGLLPGVLSERFTLADKGRQSGTSLQGDTMVGSSSSCLLSQQQTYERSLRLKTGGLWFQHAR
jgi:hypothetical protein